MKQKEFDILLDIRKPNKTDIEVVQDDINTNVFNISIIDGLEPFDLYGCDIDIVFLKNDKTTVVQSSTSDPPGVGIVNEAQGKIQCILYTNTIACPGPVIAEVKINEAGALLTTGRFEFFVRESLINEKTLESTNEFPILKQLVEEVSGIVENMPFVEEKLNEIEDANSELNQAIQTGQTLVNVLGGAITDASAAKSELNTAVNTANDVKDELYDIIAGTDFEEVLQRLENKLDIDGDSKDNTVSFTEAAEDVDIQSGEKHSTLFGKLLKSIKTLRHNIGVLANSKLNIDDIVQSDTISMDNKVPSSVVTAAHRQELDNLASLLASLNNNLAKLNTYRSIPLVTYTGDASVFENYSVNLPNRSFYEFELFMSTSHPVLGGGRYLVTGLKFTDPNQEVQRFISYASNSIKIYYRSKIGGAWGDFIAK